MSDRIARAFKRFGATRAIALVISNSFDRVAAGMVVFLRNLGLMEFQVTYLAFLLFSVIGGFARISTNAGVPEGSILGPTLFLQYINGLSDDVVCHIDIYADDTTLCSECDQASDLCKQLEFVFEVESDPQETVDWGRKWLVDFNAGKT